MQFKKLELSKLIPAEYNPRKDLTPEDKEFIRIQKSIEEFGYAEPIIVNKDLTIIGGHQRAKVMLSLGYTEADCVVLDIDKTKEKALNVALNKITGEWDNDKLSHLLSELDKESYNIELTGFDWDEAEALMKTLETETGHGADDEYEVEVPEIPISQKGDIWLLGKHRLLCGDSTKKEDVDKLLDGKKAQLVFTDPPWNVNYGATDHPSWKQRTIKNDCMSTEEFRKFLLSSAERLADSLVPGGMMYLVMSAQEWGSIMGVLSEVGFHWSSTVIWNKDRLVLSRKDYHTKYEPIWYGWKDGSARIKPLEDRSQCDVWDIARPTKSEEHPTMKPVELVERAIINSSSVNDLVLDTFGGSGTTLIACENHRRCCYMIELDEKYVDVIVFRYAEKVNDTTDIFLVRNGEKIPFEKAKN